jgi:hypothetical protein
MVDRGDQQALVESGPFCNFQSDEAKKIAARIVRAAGYFDRLVTRWPSVFGGEIIRRGRLPHSD